MTFEEWYEQRNGFPPFEGGDDETFNVQCAMREAYNAAIEVALSTLVEKEQGKDNG